jgi:hypothetical protein
MTTPKVAAQLVSEASLFDTTQASSASVINKAIDDAMITVKTVQLDFQRIACSIIQHVGTHGDIRIVRNLFSKLEDSMLNRDSSMQKFFDLYASVSFDDEGEVHFDRTKATRLNAALVKPWWKALPKAKYVPYSFNALVGQLYEQGLKKLDNMREGDILDMEQLNAIGSLYKVEVANDTVTETEVSVAA